MEMANYSNRQIEIINAATKLINGGGIQSLTTKALSESVGFSEPALYRHFKNKTEILSAMLQFYGQRLKEKINEIINDEGNGLFKLERIVKYQFDHFSRHPAIVMVIFAEASFQNDAMLSEKVKNLMSNKKSKVEAIIKTGQLDGSIRNDIDTEQLSPIFMGTMRFTILQWRMNHYKADLNHQGVELWETMHSMFAAENMK